MNTLNHAPKHPIANISLKTDFLQEARRLEHAQAISTGEGADRKLPPDDDQIESLVMLGHAADHYRDLLCGLLAHVARYRQDGAALLLAESHNTYTVMPWRLPANILSAGAAELHDSLQSEMDRLPCLEGMGISQVICAWRLRTKSRPVLFYGMELGAALVMYLHDVQGWHKLQAIDPVIDWGLRCARLASHGPDSDRSLVYADHAGLKRRYGTHERLGPVLRAMDNRVQNMLAEVDAGQEMSALLARLGAGSRPQG